MMKKEIIITLTASVFAVLVLFTPVHGATATDKPIRIGIIGPMDIRPGNHVMISAQMAAAERAIKADKVAFLIGGIVSEAVSAIQDAAADNKTIYINTAYMITSRHVARMKKNYDRYKYCFAATANDEMDVATSHLGIVEAVSTAAIKPSNSQTVYTVFGGPGGIVFGRQLAELNVPAIIAGSPSTSITPGQEIPYSIQMQPAASIPIGISDKNVAFFKEFVRRSDGENCVMSAYDIVLNLAYNIEAVDSMDEDVLIINMEIRKHESISGPFKDDPKDHRAVFGI